MARKLRFIPEGGALVEVTNRTIHGRYLLRPDKHGRLNEIVVGILGRAQRLYGMSVVAVSVLSNHLHLLLFAEDAEHLARFMGYIDTNLSKEVGRLVDWPGRLWARRYRAIVISNEEHAQVARLKYVLANGCKEQLVDRPEDWPGVHSARALQDGGPLRGYWFSRTLEYAARRRGETFGRYQYAREELLRFDPLPCWQHLPAEEVCQLVSDFVQEIELEAAAERTRTGRESLCPEEVMSKHPHQRPNLLDTSPAPDFHTATLQALQKLREAYAWVATEFQIAAKQLRQGDRNAVFPEGAFPPRRPFVSFASARAP